MVPGLGTCLVSALAEPLGTLTTWGVTGSVSVRQLQKRSQEQSRKWRVAGELGL